VFDRSSKGLMPWITYNGENVDDSQFCIEYLANKLSKDLSENLNNVEKAIAHAFFKMVEESTRWCLVLQRFSYGKPEDADLPWIVSKILGRIVVKRTKSQGYGLHQKEEVYRIGKQDLKALDDFIGNKRFLFGDRPCNEDASVFAFLCMFLYMDKGPFNEYLTSKFLIFIINKII
jgi:hypothetical protein